MSVAAELLNSYKPRGPLDRLLEMPEEALPQKAERRIWEIADRHLDLLPGISRNMAGYRTIAAARRFSIARRLGLDDLDMSGADRARFIERVRDLRNQAQVFKEAVTTIREELLPSVLLFNGHPDPDAQLILEMGALIDHDNRDPLPYPDTAGIPTSGLIRELEGFVSSMNEALTLFKSANAPKSRRGPKPHRDEYWFVTELWFLWKNGCKTSPRTRRSTDEWPFADFVTAVGREVAGCSFSGRRSVKKIDAMHRVRNSQKND